MDIFIFFKITFTPLHNISSHITQSKGIVFLQIGQKLYLEALDIQESLDLLELLNYLDYLDHLEFLELLEDLESQAFYPGLDKTKTA